MAVAALLLLVSIVVLSIKWLWPEILKRPQNSTTLPPGPAGLPVIGNLLFFLRTPLLYRGLAELGKEHGPLVWLRMGSKPVLAVQSAALAEEVVRAQDLAFADRPPPSYAMKQLRYPTEISFEPYGHPWRVAKKFLTLELLSVRRIAEFSAGRDQELRRVVADMRAACGGGSAVVNMHTRLRATTVNATFQILLRKRLVSYGEGDDDEDKAIDLGGGSGSGKVTDGLCEEFIAICHRKFVHDVFPRLGFLDDVFLRSGQRALKDVFSKMDTALQELVESRRAHRVAHSHQPPRDLADVIAGLAKDDGEGLPDGELKALLQVVLLGAPHNAAVTMEWALAELLNAPSALQTAQRELDEVVGRGRRVEESDVPQLPFLQAVIKEGMRLHPALPLLVPRYTREDVKLGGGFHVPAKTKVLVNVWAIQRDPALWERAEEFWPERFMPGGSAESVDVRGLHYSLLPFGSGRRVCPGLNFAMVIVCLVMARLLHSFDWKLPGRRRWTCRKRWTSPPNSRRPSRPSYPHDCPPTCINRLEYSHL